MRLQTCGVTCVVLLLLAVLYIIEWMYKFLAGAVPGLNCTVMILIKNSADICRFQPHRGSEQCLLMFSLIFFTACCLVILIVLDLILT